MRLLQHVVWSQEIAARTFPVRKSQQATLLGHYRRGKRKNFFQLALSLLRNIHREVTALTTLFGHKMLASSYLPPSLVIDHAHVI